MNVSVQLIYIFELPSATGVGADELWLGKGGGKFVTPTSKHVLGQLIPGRETGLTAAIRAGKQAVGCRLASQCRGGGVFVLGGGMVALGGSTAVLGGGLVALGEGVSELVTPA